jgi:hypothetical protein
MASWTRSALSLLSPVLGLNKDPFRDFHAGFNPLLRDRVFFFSAGVERDRRGGWLSIAARKMRLMRVW